MKGKEGTAGRSPGPGKPNQGKLSMHLVISEIQCTEMRERYAQLDSGVPWDQEI